MINLDKLYHDESYALKVLIGLIDKYLSTDEEKIKEIKLVSALPDCIPGRRVGGIFYQKNLSDEDQRVI